SWICQPRCVLDPSSRSFPLFFSGARHLRVLHSFPTRRSSDLFVRRSSSGGRRKVLHKESKQYLHIDGGRSAFAYALHKYSPSFRSEEHTSELQSRENLVCRLLLEKKKKKNIKSAISYLDNTNR